MCWSCYHTPGVRDLYPLSPHHANRRGAGLGAVNYAPYEPTSALPGTPAKFAVLEQRAANCQPLHHPQDARLSVQ